MRKRKRYDMCEDFLLAFFNKLDNPSAVIQDE